MIVTILKIINKLRNKIKELWNIDSFIDVTVDLLLLIFDVITSPILIFVRLIRHFFNKWIRNSIKAVLKAIAHWFERKREYRLKHNHGLFRTYWWLWIFQPIIIFAIIFIIAFMVGVNEGINEVIQELYNSV